jgi:hypothetical protein
MAIEDSAGVVLLPIVPNICHDLGRCDRTIKRWLKDPKMKMPRPRRIRERLYLVKDEYLAWKHDVLWAALDHGMERPIRAAAAAPGREGETAAQK